MPDRFQAFVLAEARHDGTYPGLMRTWGPGGEVTVFLSKEDAERQLRTLLKDGHPGPKLYVWSIVVEHDGNSQVVFPDLRTKVALS